MGDVFASLSQSIQRPNQLEQISGRIAIALLSEGKDKTAVPFAAFAEMGEIRTVHHSSPWFQFEVVMSSLFLFVVCQKERGHLTMSYLGRIGVSLMLRYHKTHQWAKVIPHSLEDACPVLLHILIFWGGKLFFLVKRSRKCHKKPLQVLS